MKRVFISGSIAIKTLPASVVQSIEAIESQDFTVLVGDAPGVDALVQQKLKDDGYKNVLVCCIQEKPRHCLSEHFHVIQVPVDHEIKSERKKQKEKDRYMTQFADYALVLWDGRSKGSFNNIIRCIESSKLAKVYLTSEERFLSKEEISTANIAEIHKKHIGLTLTEMHQRLKQNGRHKFKTPQDLKRYLIDQQFVVLKDQEIHPAKGYDKYFRLEKYKGRTNLRYAPELVELVG